jgi:hypothetical protein
MDREQLQWIIEHDYLEWQKEIAREELMKRRFSN